MSHSCTIVSRATLAALSLAWVLPSMAHEGPPFPILVDRTTGPYTVSVWSDPDIGTGTFFVILEPRTGSLVPPSQVTVTVQPVSGRLAAAIYEAEPQRARHGARYFTEVAFDRGELWSVRVAIEGPAGGGELSSEVEATPDGSIGPIGLLVYLLPFLAVGFLWLRAVHARRGS